MSRYVLRTDGGARGNPGPAASAFVLESADGTSVSSGGRFLGTTTNNIAEYQALLWGLRVAIQFDARPLTVYSDSELMVRQLEGRYRVKNEGLKPLYDEACRLMARLGDVRVVHVRREDNKDADRLCNEAMDARAIVGDAPEHPEDGPAQGTLFA